LARKKQAAHAPPIDKARVLELLSGSPHATKRDLARLLGLKGSDRIALKRILKELAAEGDITGTRRKGFAKPNELPEAAVLEITGQDTDGELLARPQTWDSNEEPPPITIVPGTTPAGQLFRGERVLSRLSKTPDGY